MSEKKVRYPAGGELTFRADFGDTYPKTCGDNVCAEIPHNGVLQRMAGLSKPLINGRSAQVNVRTIFVFDHSTLSTNGFVWEKENSTDTTFDDRLEAGKETTRVRLDNRGKSIFFGGGVKMNMQTSTITDSTWRIFALAFIENAYLTE